ncbi:hypothetical protein ACWC4D_09975 [Streptomyces sp. NPDC001288]|uniref:hypothetical protein n=1 Tax=Streptomyces sp. NPDC001297 TaxID=3364559 RepID=UPI00367B63A3
MGPSAPAGREPATRITGRRLTAVAMAGLHQEEAADRLLLCRLTTGAAILRTVWHLPPGRFLADYRPLVDEAAGKQRRSSTLPPLAYEALRYVAAASTGAWMLGARHPAVKVTANASFALLQRQVVDLDDSLYSYNSHLNVFLCLLSLADDTAEPGSTDVDQEYASALLLAMHAYYAAMYLQSGLSKLTSVGWKWTQGRVLRAAWAELGTPAGKRLSASSPALARGASTGALLYELAFAPALVAMWERKALLGLSSAAFHGTVKATMNISFWHLSWFSVPLFTAPAKSSHGYRRLLAAGARSMRAGRALTAAGALAGAAPLVTSWLKRRNRRV